MTKHSRFEPSTLRTTVTERYARGAEQLLFRPGPRHLVEALRDWLADTGEPRFNSELECIFEQCVENMIEHALIRAVGKIDELARRFRAGKAAKPDQETIPLDTAARMEQRLARLEVLLRSGTVSYPTPQRDCMGLGRITAGKLIVDLGESTPGGLINRTLIYDGEDLAPYFSTAELERLYNVAQTLIGLHREEHRNSTLAALDKHLGIME